MNKGFHINADAKEAGKMVGKTSYIFPSVLIIIITIIFFCSFSLSGLGIFFSLFLALCTVFSECEEREEKKLVFQYACMLIHIKYFT